jgi:glycosyltransferase involved in cell wall biosynthesis
MKVLIATPLYPPEGGGPATYSKILEDELASVGDSVTLVKFSDFHKYPKYIRNIRYFFAVLEKAFTADIVLVLDPVSTGFPALVAGSLAGKKVVVKVVGDYAWEQGVQKCGVKDSLDEFVRTKQVPALCGFFRFIQTTVARLSTKVIVPSDYLKGIVSLWGINSSKIETIYNSIALPNAAPVAGAAVSAPYIITVARLVPWKGIDALIETYARVRAEFSELSLVIVGDGPDRELLENLAVNAGGTIRFTGGLPHEEALALVHGAKLFVLNSTYEGLSHVLIESLMLGTPVLASDAGGNPETVSQGENGLIVPLGSQIALQEALEKMLRSDTFDRAMIATKAREKFAVSKMIEKTRALLASLV